MPKPEMNRQAVIDRLTREGWVNEGGAKHDLYRHSGSKRIVIVPRHKELSPGVARQIGKAAGW